MPKFYPHDMEYERQLSFDLIAKAKQVNPELYLGEANLLRLEHVAKNGLPSCYTSIDDMIVDFYPDFSWTPTEFTAEVNYVLSQTDRLAKVNEAFLRDWDFDIIAELKLALEAE